MDVGQFLSMASAIVALTALGGLGLMRTNVTNLRATLNDARGEITDKDRRLAEAEKKIALQRSELDKQQIEIATLDKRVTGEAHWQALGQMLHEHHVEAQQHWSKDEELLQTLIDRGTSP